VWTFQSKKSVQLGVICQICLKIWYVVIDILLGTITVVFPATTRTLFLVVYRLPAATVAPLLKDFVCKKQNLESDIIIVDGMFSRKRYQLLDLQKAWMRWFLYFSSIYVNSFFFFNFFAKKIFLNSLQNIV
jgi:hypothetical protein